jgi:hypothetical protein
VNTTPAGRTRRGAACRQLLSPPGRSFCIARSPDSPRRFWRSAPFQRWARATEKAPPRVPVHSLPSPGPPRSERQPCAFRPEGSVPIAEPRLDLTSPKWRRFHRTAHQQSLYPRWWSPRPQRLRDRAWPSSPAYRLEPHAEGRQREGALPAR